MNVDNVRLPIGTSMDDICDAINTCSTPCILVIEHADAAQLAFIVASAKRRTDRMISNEGSHIFIL